MKNNPFTPSQLAQMKSFYQNELEQTQLKLRHIIDVLNRLENQPAADESLLKVKAKDEKKVKVEKVGKPEAASVKRRGRPKKVQAAVAAAPTQEIAVTKGKRERPAKAESKSKTKLAAVAAKDKPKASKTKVVNTRVKKAKPAVAKAKTKSVKSKRTPKKPIKVNVGGQKVKWTDFIVNSLSSDRKPCILSDFTGKAIKALDISAADSERAKMAIAGTLTRMVKEAKQITTIKKPGQKAKFYALVEWLEDGKLKPEFAV